MLLAQSVGTFHTPATCLILEVMAHFLLSELCFTFDWWSPTMILLNMPFLFRCTKQFAVFPFELPFLYNVHIFTGWNDWCPMCWTSFYSAADGFLSPAEWEGHTGCQRKGWKLTVIYQDLLWNLVFYTFWLYRYKIDYIAVIDTAGF